VKLKHLNDHLKTTALLPWFFIVRDAGKQEKTQKLYRQQIHQ